MNIRPEPVEGQTFAAVDLGSNSFHLVVARFEHGQLQVIDRIKEMVRLAEGVDERGMLDPVVERRALDCLTVIGQRIEQIDSHRIAAVGTNALRLLEKGWRFQAEAEARLGAPIEIISGHEEARLVYLGVAHGVAERGNQRLVIDIGGGSTEFALGREFSPEVLQSLYFGCVSVARDYFADQRITEHQWKKAKTAVAMELQRIVWLLKSRGWQEVLGSSGTMRAVRDVIVNQGWSRRGITVPGLDRLREQLMELGEVENIRLDGLSERRRPVFVSGAVIISACMEVLEIDRILVAEYSLREGLLHHLIGRLQDDDPRGAAVKALMEKYWIDAEQSARVESVANALFVQVRSAWKLENNARDWLAWGARLHELGLAVSHHGYHRHGAYLIENSDLPGFSRQEQQILATLIRQHRRRPDTECLSPMLDLLRPQLFKVSALLRIAVLLNRTRSEHAQPEIAAHASSGQLQLTFPEGWLEHQPLTQADLEQESSLLGPLGVQLKVF